MNDSDERKRLVKAMNDKRRNIANHAEQKCITINAIDYRIQLTMDTEAVDFDAAYTASTSASASASASILQFKY